MKIKSIHNNINIVVANIEVNLNGEVREGNALCAEIKDNSKKKTKIIPLNTPDGRPIFMKFENAIEINN